MSEQSTTELAGNIQGLADFLSEDPIEESHEEELASDTEPEEESDTQDESEQTEQDESEEDAAEEAAPRTYKVHVKGDDGQDAEVEVSEDELLKGYMRQSHFTRETQALSKREQEVTAALTNKFTEFRDYYLQEAEAAKQAVLQLAGLKSQDELAIMAQNDPAGWVAEQQRQQYIAQILNGLDQKMRGERDQAMQQQQAQEQRQHAAAYKQSWSDLQSKGIDRDALAKIYADVSKAYDIPEQQLLANMDAKAVFVMRDAIAYRNLQNKAKETAKVAKEAPRLPNKQNAPQQTRKSQALDQKFKSGKAKLNDLAAFLR